MHFVLQGAAACGVLDLSRIIRNGTVRNPFSARVPLHPRDEEPPWGEEQRNETSRTNEEEEEKEEEGSRQRQRREEGTEPVFERSGESGSYTFTDLHYPHFVPSSLPLAPRSPSDRLDTHPGAPPAHKLSRYTRARCTRHRRDPQNDTECPPPRALPLFLLQSPTPFSMPLLSFILKLCHAASTERVPRRELDGEQRRAW